MTQMGTEQGKPLQTLADDRAPAIDSLDRLVYCGLHCGLTSNYSKSLSTRDF